jgi:S1-C subfamily serine protease
VHGDVLDLVLLAAVVLFAVSGYRRGFIIGVLSVVGFVGGGVLGARYASDVASRLSSLPPSAVGLLTVFVAASLGHLLAATLGAALRRRVVWTPLRQVDSAAGSVLAIVPVLFIAWLLGRAVLRTSYTTLVSQVRHSEVLALVGHVVPASVESWFSGFLHLVERNGFSFFLNGPGGTLIPVPAPDPAVVSNPAVRADATDIVKIVGIAPSCSRRIEGSGFVFSPGHILTNAHVVAGVTAPEVQVPGGGSYPARVVLYDPQTDLAVLYVPQITSAPLRLNGAVGTGASAVVAGYPENGPFTVVAARVRVREEVRSEDIYSTGTVTRQVYSLRAQVLPGNSGGPMLSPTGLVDGVVFAAATNVADTGYALTAAQVSADAAAGRDAVSAVSTQACD